MNAGQIRLLDGARREGALKCVGSGHGAEGAGYLSSDPCRTTR
jgi:hypothetical protein